MRIFGEEREEVNYSKFVFTLFTLFSLSFASGNTDTNKTFQCLIENGFTELQLSRNANGQFESFIQLDNGDSLRVIIDMGSNRTLFDIKKIKKLKIEMKNSTMKLESITGKQDVKTADIRNIKIGKANTGPMTVHVTELDYLNKQLKAFGNNEIDALIGADLLTIYSAVIDVKNSKLYMRIK